MNITEEHSWLGQHLIVTWHDASSNPPRNLVTQASGICFTDDSRIVLVTTDGKTWHLPGGHPEDNETIEKILLNQLITRLGFGHGFGSMSSRVNMK